MFRFTCIVIFVALSFGASAQTASQSWYQNGNKTQWVEVVSTAPLRLAGGKGTTTLRFQVKPDLHINSHKPSSELLIPTELAFPDAKGLKLSVRYPEGHDITLLGAEKVNVYTGQFDVAVNALAAHLRAGKNVVPAELKYQACNSTSCFPPKSLKFDLEVEVAP